MDPVEHEKDSEKYLLKVMVRLCKLWRLAYTLKDCKSANECVAAFLYTCNEIKKPFDTGEWSECVENVFSRTGWRSEWSPAMGSLMVDLFVERPDPNVLERLSWDELDNEFFVHVLRCALGERDDHPVGTLYAGVYQDDIGEYDCDGNDGLHDVE